MPERLVVIGGDAGGLSAATNARRLRPPEDLEILVFERGDWISFSACGEPYYVAGIVDPIEELLARSEEDFERAGIRVRRRAEVVGIDTEARTVTVRHRDEGGEEREEVVGYDYLVYATGARSRRLPIDGADLRGVYHLHTLDDALALRAALETGREVRRAVVVGGGYIGIEMAEAFHVRGIQTTIVDAARNLLSPTLDVPFADELAEAVRSRGIAVQPEHLIECFRGEDGVVSEVGCAERSYPADVVLVAVGTVPNVELAEAAGLRIGESGGVWVDERMRTSAPGVWAAGDCAESTHRLTRRPVNIHLGTYANRQGRIAGLDIGGADVTFPGVLGTAITKVLDIEIARTGLTEDEARGAGYDPVAVTFGSATGSSYWPERERMRVRAVADRPSRRLLGAQIFGGAGSAKRIDALAMAIWNEMTVDAMVNADLSYAPPFSGAWDPVLVAARKVQEALGGVPRG